MFTGCDGGSTVTLADGAIFGAVLLPSLLPSARRAAGAGELVAAQDRSTRRRDHECRGGGARAQDLAVVQCAVMCALDTRVAHTRVGAQVAAAPAPWRPRRAMRVVDITHQRLLPLRGSLRARSKNRSCANGHAQT